MIDRMTFSRMDSDERFKYTMFVVEANSYEAQALWYVWHDSPRFKQPPVTWEQVNPGFLSTIGQIGDKPVCIDMFWNLVNGVPVLFYHPTSKMVDWDMIEEWLKNNCNPRYDNNHRRAHTDAQNFHHMVHATKELQELLRKKLEKEPIEL